MAKVKRIRKGRRGIFLQAMACVLVFSMMTACFPAEGMQSVQADSGTVKYAVEGGNLSFNKSTGYITGADKSVTKAEIPEKIDGVAVKGLKQWAFYEVHGLTDVSLPEGLTDIEKGAFYGCDALESIVIPEGVTEISEMQFYKCTALKKVSLPASLEVIGRCAFYGCSSLQYVDIPGSVYRLCDLAFDGCSSLKGVYFVEGVTVDMGTWVFNDCYSLEKAVNVPDARWSRFIRS